MGNALTHRNVSFVKSALRIFAGTALIVDTMFIAGIFLILAELLGIIEEIV